jgi:fructosamine-3-kinase
MADALSTAVEEAIAGATGERSAIASRGGMGGGCINNAQRIRLEDGRTFFLKSNPSPLPGMFEREAEALAALAGPGVIRVPRPVATGGGDGAAPFIVMEYIEEGRPGRGFFADFGASFARLHQEAQAQRFGFDHDNYIGSTPQPNGWMDDWVAFWRERRLGFQLGLARKRGLSDSEMDRLGDTLMERLPEVIGQPDEPPCLLHGDLWSGNFLADADGRPVLIDPAAYYGRREADLAMTMVFGGFHGDFYKAYEDVWPLADGSRDRLEVYKLYHYLNHLNLFGSSYYSSCMSILRRFG